MRKLQYIAIISFFFAACSKLDYDQIQKDSFVKFFGSQYINSANDIIESNSGYVFVGYTLEDPTGRKGLITKVNEFGNEQWRGTSTFNGAIELNGITLGNDNSYVVCGEIKDTTGQIDLYVAKFDLNGTLIWENSFGGIEDQSANKIVRANDGGYVMIGNTTRGGGNGNPNGISDMMACKITETGDSLILNQFGGANSDFGNDIINYGNQYFAVGTSSSFNGAFEPFHSGKLIYLVKLGNQLGEDDAHCWGDSLDQTGNSISLDNDGNLLIGGGYQNSTTATNGGYVVLIDPNNIRIKLGEIQVNTTGQEEIYDVKMHADGSVCATGVNTIDNIQKIAVYNLNLTDYSLKNHIELGFTGNASGNRLKTSVYGGFIIAGSSIYEQNSVGALIKVDSNIEL